MAQKKSNKFSNLHLLGLLALLTPLFIVLLGIILYVTHNIKEAKPKDVPKEKKIEKVVEKVYIHDTIRIPCKRKHCDEQVPKSEPPVTTVKTKDTL